MESALEGDILDLGMESGVGTGGKDNILRKEEGTGEKGIGLTDRRG